MKFSRELLKGSIKNLILSVVEQEALYGYQIVKEIAGRSEDALQFGEGSIYPALHSLEKEGYLTSKWVKQEAGPDRKYYALTSRGGKALKSAKKEWQEFSLAINQVLGAKSLLYV